MIIINQNKEIINFDTIDFLDFEYHENGCCAINANFAHCIVTLGIYETEERAKEVLEDFADFYSRMDYTEPMEAIKGIGTILSRDKAVYYMAKE